MGTHPTIKLVLVLHCAFFLFISSDSIWHLSEHSLLFSSFAHGRFHGQNFPATRQIVLSLHKIPYTNKAPKAFFTGRMFSVTFPILSLDRRSFER
ncbi:hypothetical protein EJ08DRAFT_200944 [Tothia fuscella]|uniref:Secreted protein n=1 Tax=Tothia fuscella TaxID=1048955 RepID=A0A9P4TZ93_9PEZI|nr:hypothetical protein EJ08DRAFT_200944 [Tothia fuscella]